MKLPRHAIARNTVGELQSLRQQQISPREAAGAELAKFGAIGAGIDAASEVAKVIGDTQIELDNANDKVDSAIQDAYMEDALSNLKAEHEERSLTDPTWTRENYVENTKAILAARQDSIKNLRRPENRTQSEKIHGATAGLALSKANEDSLVLDARKIETNWKVAFNEAINNKQSMVADKLLAAATDITNGATPILDPVEAQKAQFKLDEVRMQEEATTMASAVEDAYLDGGKDAGQAAYEALVRNESLDPDVKKKALLEAQAHQANYFRSQQDEKDRENALVIRAKTIYSEGAKVGQVGNAENDLALENGTYGDPKSASAMAAWASVYQQIQGFNRQQVGVLDVTNAVNTGQILEPSKANRLLLDGYMEQQVEATGIQVDSDDYFRLAANTAQSTGTLPHREQMALNGGFVSKPEAEKYFPLWKYLKDNDQLKPDLGLTPAANTMYMAMDSLVSYGTPQETATEIIWNARDLKPADKDALTLDYEKEEAQTKSFKNLINSEFFDAADSIIPFVSPETETKMSMRYAEVRKAVYMATNGNIAAATDAADKAIKAGWGPSNFGNADPNDYTIQENPLGKDMSTFQELIINDLNNLKVPGGEDLPAGQAGVTFNVYTDEGYKQTKYLDKEEVSFVEIPQLDENRRDGVRRYQVLNNGRPVVNMDTGLVVSFPISSNDARNITNISDMRTARAEEVTSIQDRITKLEGDIAENAKVKSPYFDGPAAGAELEGLKRALPAAKLRNDEVTYSMYPMFSGSQLPKVVD